MSEKTAKRGGAGGQGAGKGAAATAGASGNDGGKFSTGLLKILSDFDSLCKNAGGLKEYEKLMSAHSNLQLELQNKTNEIERLKKETDEIQAKKDAEIAKLHKEVAASKVSADNLLAQFGEKYVVWDTEANKLKASSEELREVKEELKKTKEAAKVADQERNALWGERAQSETKAKKLEEDLATSRSKCKRRELKLAETLDDLKKSRDILEELRDDLGFLPLDESTM